MLKVLAIDGMTAPRIIWNSLILPMQAKYKFEATYSEFQDWPKHLNTEWDIVCGHSLGGDSAIRLCKTMKVQPKALLTLAPRFQTDVKSASLWDWFMPTDSYQTFLAPNAVTHNFWTYGPLPSAPMVGAKENVNVSSLFIWHGNAPSAPAVQKCFEGLVK